MTTGTRLDAVVSSELLATVFYPGSPLHDGAALIRSNRVIAVGCTLPLSDSPQISTMIHTRHKAAIGVTEQSDAVVVVVSEETGTISLAVEGQLDRELEADTLRSRLQELLSKPVTDNASAYRMIFRRSQPRDGKNPTEQTVSEAPPPSESAAQPISEEAKAGS